MSATDIDTLPNHCGISLRSAHFDVVLDTLPEVAWWEIHSENFFGRGGKPIRLLDTVRKHYPVSFHGVGLSLGSTDPLNRDHLAQLKSLVDDYQPGLISEHVSWSSVGGVYFNDLLPLPYTEEALDHLVDRVSQVQDALGRRILMENPSTYLTFTDSVIPEHEFLVALARRSGCGLLLDVNNVYVNASNHGFDADDYLANIPGELVGEIHLAGHTVNTFEDGRVVIDSHNQPVCEPVWQLFEQTIRRIGPKPSLIEWDTDLPELAVLQAEAATAESLMERRHALAS